MSQRYYGKDGVELVPLAPWDLVVLQCLADGPWSMEALTVLVSTAIASEVSQEDVARSVHRLRDAKLVNRNGVGFSWPRDGSFGLTELGRSRLNWREL